MNKRSRVDYRKFNKKNLLSPPKGDKELNLKKINYDEDNTLQIANRAWDDIQSLRLSRARNRDYTFGKQWNDLITLNDGRTITEEAYLKEQGKVPLKNNLIRQLVKNVVGQYRNTMTQPVCIARDRAEQGLGELLSTTMGYVYQHNQVWEIDGRTLEEFLISGVCFHKIVYGERNGKRDVWVDEINPTRIFYNTMQDSRNWDCTLIGELHDMPIAPLLQRFAKGDRARAKEIREIYSNAHDKYLQQSYDSLSGDRVDGLEFSSPVEPNLCRVIEVWEYKSVERLKCHDTLNGTHYIADIELSDEIDAENARRVEDAAKQNIAPEDVPQIDVTWFIDTKWHYKFLTPMGHILEEGETPYWHASHPYALKLYPLFDGEIHSFVEDVIDQQRYINRLITLLDFIMGSSAKGVLLFPEDQIPDGMTIEDVADEWTRYNGVILFKPRAGSPLPQQISVNATNIGAYELLNLQMKLFDDISGVHGAMQGRTSSSGTPYALYAQQMQNSALNLVDVFESFKSFRQERDTKIMKMIQQYYSSDTYLQIAGVVDEVKLKGITEDEVQNAEFDISITESTSSPVYRTISNEFLLELFRMGQITLDMLLENGSFPFADKLQQSLTKQREDMLAQQQQMPLQGGGLDGGV